MVAIPDGFLVPFKTKGGIKLVNITGSGASMPVRITEESGEDWFYHRVQWVDMDNDGDYDALTCRARKPLFGTLFSYDEKKCSNMYDLVIRFEEKIEYYISYFG